MILFKRILTAVSAIFAVVALSACSGDESGRRRLEKMLDSDYSAEVEYSVDFMGNPLVGEAKITKCDTVRIDILSPDPYSGISVTADANDRASVIGISFSGVRAEIPKGSLEKLEFVVAMFSYSVSNAVARAKNDSFLPCDEPYTAPGLAECVPYECKFSVGDTDYFYVYDSKTGLPLELFAKNGSCSAEIKINKLKTPEIGGLEE